MPDPYRDVRTREVAQSEQALGTVANSAGGYSFALDDMARLTRFLVLGTEGGTYYIRQNDLTRDNAAVIERLIKAGRGAEVIGEIVAVSTLARNPRHQPVCFALAYCAGCDDPATRAHALAVLPDVCRTGTHLFYFARYVEQFRGWGRGLRRAIADWYLKRDLHDLCLQLAKYRQREGWSHRDLLRLSKPRPIRGSEHDGALAWAVGKPHDNIPAWLTGIDTITTPDDIERQRYPWEVVPDQMLTKPETWRALIPHTGLGAVVRNLGRMTANGTIKPLNNTSVAIVNRLTNPEAVKRSRIHPISVLVGASTYASGKGMKGKLTWQPVTGVMAALEKTFRLAFGNVNPANRRTLIGLDVSSSMGWGTVAGTPLTPAEAAAAMCLITLETEPHTQVIAFARQLLPIALIPGMRLSDAVRRTTEINFGSTDCAQPMLYALEHGLDVETFIVYTDSETWAGRIHPHQALAKYRSATGIPARLIVVGMTSNGFTIADPNDAGMLDVVGFDTAAPHIIADFSAGRI